MGRGRLEDFLTPMCGARAEKTETDGAGRATSPGTSLTFSAASLCGLAAWRLQIAGLCPWSPKAPKAIRNIHVSPSEINLTFLLTVALMLRDE